MLGIEQSTRGGGEEEVSFAILKRHPFPAVAAAVASGKSGNANS